LVVERATQDNLCMNRIKNVDVIIWDEVSMSSRRVFEIVNRVHLHKHSETTDLTPLFTQPFDGIQLIIVGEFLQLRPVPNLLDAGEFIFKSPLFTRAITHRFELKTLMRQSDANADFIQCLKEVRMGECSDATLAFIKELKRPLRQDEKDITHIFFRRIPAKVYNMDRLEHLPGPLITLQSTDNGDA